MTGYVSSTASRVLYYSEKAVLDWKRVSKCIFPSETIM